MLLAESTRLLSLLVDHLPRETVKTVRGGTFPVKGIYPMKFFSLRNQTHIDNHKYHEWLALMLRASLCAIFSHTIRYSINKTQRNLRNTPFTWLTGKCAAHIIGENVSKDPFLPHLNLYPGQRRVSTCCI